MYSQNCFRLPACTRNTFNGAMVFEKPNLRAILLAVAFLSSLTEFNTMSTRAADSETKMLQTKTIQRRLQSDAKIDYLLFLPQGYSDESTKRWPLIFFLHGSGERGSDVWKVATHGPSKYIEKHPEFPFIMVAPQCPSRETWSRDGLMDLLDQSVKTYRVDTNRIYLTGLSMGGFGVWELATSYPERFAAVVPICGGGRFISVLMAGGDGRLAALQSLPVWAFHGAKDPVVPVAESERMVKMLKDAGCKEVELTIYPEAQHNSWTETYNNPKLYEWFLKHERASK
jgi:predicted peptidase